MRLTDGYHEVPEGHLAAVVTHMEMRQRPGRAAARAPDGVALTPWVPDAAAYLDLFRAVGGPWLWFSRLNLGADDLTRILIHPDVDIYRLHQDGAVIGFLELDRRRMPEIEIAYMGLLPEATGQGAGRYLLDKAIDLGFDAGAAPLIVHTCTLDHPRALEAYLKAGFKAVSRSVEVAPDPRLSGRLGRDLHPWIPVV